MNKGLLMFRGRTIGEAVGVCVIALVVGLSVNFKTVRSAFTGQAPVVDALSGEGTRVEQADGTMVDVTPFPVALDEMNDFLAEGALIIDSRNVDDYNIGHIAGAVSLPLGTIEQTIGRFKVDVSPERTLIVYCSGYGCPDSGHVAVRLMQEGFVDVLIYEGGFPEWRDAGRAVEMGASE